METMSSSSSSSSRLARSNSELQTLSSSRKLNYWKSETSPERTKVWTEPLNPKTKSHRKVPVVYYLTRNGQLQHPHFIEVSLSSSDGLYLRDVINRLNSLRGKAMASMYSWSSKRSYKNGFVWHDLAENDFIYPAHGKEYVLKGSELLEAALVSKIDETPNLNSNQQTQETPKSGDDADFPVAMRRRNQSWSSIDLHDYKVVYKADSSGELAGRAAADASTQTDEKRRRRRAVKEVAEEGEENQNQNHTTELSREEISPPPSDSSPETLESLMKDDGKLIRFAAGDRKDDLTASNHPSGRMKASTVLMQLLTCGSISFKDCGPGYAKDHPGFSLTASYKPRLPRGGEEENMVEKENPLLMNENGSGNRDRNRNRKGVKVALEDKEYFSGSLIQETGKDEFAVLNRSSSYNADGSSGMELKDKEMEGVGGKCIPRRPRSQASKKEVNN